MDNNDNNNDIYEETITSKTIVLAMNELENNIHDSLLQYLQSHYEGHCEIDGYIDKNSIKILSFSSGCIVNGNELSFDTVFECRTCCPMYGLILECVVKSITNAGIRCECINQSPSPIIAHVAKETCRSNDIQPYYNSLTENSIIRIRVMDHRFELYDRYISVIAELIPI